jgi:hypothetical protein
MTSTALIPYASAENIILNSIWKTDPLFCAPPVWGTALKIDNWAATSHLRGDFALQGLLIDPLRGKELDLRNLHPSVWK